MKYSIFRTNNLSKTGTSMKLTKNLVIIERSLWTRCSIKNIYMLTIALTCRPSPCSPMFALDAPPLSANVIIEYPQNRKCQTYN